LKQALDSTRHHKRAGQRSAHRWRPLHDSRIAKLCGGAAIRCSALKLSKALVGSVIILGDGRGVLPALPA
jgi:hypothetical protein